LVGRPPYGHGVWKSSIWRPIHRRSCKVGAIRGWLRQENASAGERTGKEQARGKASRTREIRRAWREERGRNQRIERSARRETYLLALTNAFARAAEPSSIPHPCEEQPPAGCCFPAASSGPPSSRTQAASPLPSLFPTRAGAAAGGQVFPHRLLWSTIEQEQDRVASSSLPLPSSRSRTPSSQVGTLLLLYIWAEYSTGLDLRTPRGSGRNLVFVRFAASFQFLALCFRCAAALSLSLFCLLSSRTAAH
jgi:hypothetical protein